MDKIFDSSKRHVLDNEERRKSLPPELVLSLLHIKSHHNFLDIGAGTGYFFIPVIETKGRTGKNYALDISKTMLEELNDKLKHRQIEVELFHGDAQNIPLKARSIDKALLALVFHEFDNPTNYLNELKRILSPDGEIGILEWSAKETIGGPPMHERISEEKLKSVLVTNGWKFVREKTINEKNYMHIYSPV